MGSIERRLRNLEDSSGGRCPECAERLKRIVVRYPGDPYPEAERCPACGGFPHGTIIRVIYGEEEEDGV